MADGCYVEMGKSRYLDHALTDCREIWHDYACILTFRTLWAIKILSVDRVVRVNMRHHMQNFVAIGETVVEIWRFFDFSKWPPPSWIFPISNF